MKASLDEFVSVVDRMTARLDELESRVAALEHWKQAHAQASTEAISATDTHPLAQVSRSSNVMPVIGKIFLGVAGAYVLRALAESGAIPMWAVAGVAMVYAGMWLLFAARTSPSAVFASTAYATTSAVILLPMLWELTLRFKVMPAPVTATVLVVFMVVASGLAWKGRLISVVCTPAAFAAVAAGVLLVGTRNPFPFAVVLLLMALMTEAAASKDRWPRVRPLVAVPVDLAMLALIGIYTASDGVSPDYKPLARGELLGVFAALSAIYGASVVSRTLVLRRKIGVFEIGQMVAAFLITGLGVLRTTHYGAATGLGALCLLVAAACYWSAFARFAESDHERNYHAFATWAVALALTGSVLCFPANANALLLGVAALAAIFLGLHSGGFTLVFHGTLYLTLMALVSGLLQYGGTLLIGEPSRQQGWPVWTSCLYIAGGYAQVWRALNYQRPNRQELNDEETPWPQRILHLALAALAAYAMLAMAMTAGLMVVPAANAAQVAGLRTFMICLMAVFLGWSGSRWRPTELIWLAYTFVAFCALKILFEDLRAGSASTIAFSLFCYGLVWVLVPRFARASKAG